MSQNCSLRSILTTYSNGSNWTNTTYSTHQGNIDSLKAKLKLFSSILISFGILIIILNSYVLSFFIRNKHLRRKSNLFLLSMAAADLLAGILGTGLYIFQHQLGKTDLEDIGHYFSWGILITSITLHMYSTIGLLNYCFVIGDRCYNLSHPFHHRIVVTSRKVLILILGAWMVSIVSAFLPLAWRSHVDPREKQRQSCIPISRQKLQLYRKKDHNIYKETFFFVYPIFLTFIVACLIRILCIVYSRRHPGVQPSNRCGVSKIKERKQEIKATVVLLVMFICLLLFMLPVIFPLFQLSDETIEDVITLSMGLYLARFISASINPILYTIYKADFWKACQKDFQKVFPYKRHTLLLRNQQKVQEKRNSDRTQAVSVL